MWIFIPTNSACVCLHGCCARVRLGGRWGYSRRKNHKLWKISWQLTWNANNHTAASLSTAIDSKVQFPEHIRESLQGRSGSCEDIPLCKPVEEGKLFIFCVATSIEPEAFRTTPKPRRSIKFHSKAGRRYRWGLGWSQRLHISQALSRGAKTRGSANRFGAGPPIQRNVWRNRPNWKKNGSKITLGRGPYGFREPVWKESVPCGRPSYQLDII